MSAITTVNATITGLALVTVLLAAGITLLVIGRTEAGLSLVNLAIGIVIGGGGVHATNAVVNGGNGAD